MHKSCFVNFPSLLFNLSACLIFASLYCSSNGSVRRYPAVIAYLISSPAFSLVTLMSHIILRVFAILSSLVASIHFPLKSGFVIMFKFLHLAVKAVSFVYPLAGLLAITTNFLKVRFLFLLRFVSGVTAFESGESNCHCFYSC